TEVSISPDTLSTTSGPLGQPPLEVDDHLADRPLDRLQGPAVDGVDRPHRPPTRGNAPDHTGLRSVGAGGVRPNLIDEPAELLRSKEIVTRIELGVVPWDVVDIR